MRTQLNVILYTLSKGLTEHLTRSIRNFSILTPYAVRLAKRYKFTVPYSESERLVSLLSDRFTGASLFQTIKKRSYTVETSPKSWLRGSRAKKGNQIRHRMAGKTANRVRSPLFRFTEWEGNLFRLVNLSSYCCLTWKDSAPLRVMQFTCQKCNIKLGESSQ